MRPHLVLGVLFTCLPLLAQTATYAVFTNLNLALQPPDREFAQMANDPVRGRTLVAGGRWSGNTRQDTWEWNGATWQQVVPPTQLNWSRPTQLVFAGQLGQILAVSGESSAGGQAMQIHRWTGTTWVLVPVTGTAPLSRAEVFAIAWDSTRGVLVMFGHPFGAETWEWNGSTWALRGTGGPVPRSEHKMVYDPVRQCTVLYGGVSLTNARLDDTWEWNGVYWLERFGITAPDVFGNQALAYDGSRQRIVLHGGYTISGNATGDVWEFDGAGWQPRTAQGAPSYVYNHSMAFETASNRFLLFGGFLPGGVPARTRTITFVTGTVASSALHGAGCAGPAGVPSCNPIGASRPVLGTNFQLRFGSLPNSPLALVFGTIGFQDQAWNSQPLPIDLTAYGLTSCSLRIEPVTTVVLSNTLGVADWSIAVPAGVGLDGQQFFVQGAVLTPGWNPAGAVLSASRRGVIGIL